MCLSSHRCAPTGSPSPPGDAALRDPVLKDAPKPQVTRTTHRYVHSRHSLSCEAPLAGRSSGPQFLEGSSRYSWVAFVSPQPHDNVCHLAYSLFNSAPATLRELLRTPSRLGDDDLGILLSLGDDLLVLCLATPKATLLGLFFQACSLRPRPCQAF